MTDTPIDSALRPPDPLVGRGLRLRRLRPGDAEAIYAGWTSDPAAMHYLPWVAHTDARETAEFVERAMLDWASGEKYRFLVFEDRVEEGEAEASAAIGFGMLKIEEECRAEVGFVVFPEHRGRGVASRIAGALSDWALAQPPIWRAFGICDVDNRGSARALERAGFVRESRWERWSVHPNISSEPRDVFCYVRLRKT